MNRISKFVVAASLPIVVVSLAGHAVAASAPPTEPPSSGLGDVVPADFVILTDDTGTISVGVPGSWTDIDTAPDGVFPSIEASTDREAYHATFDVAGVTYRAGRFTEDTVAAAQTFGLQSGCANEQLVPYDDGVFVGSHLIYTECTSATSAAEFHVIAANPANQAFTAQLRIQITGPDELPILEGILATFNVASGSGTTDTGVQTGSTVPAAPSPTTTAGPNPSAPSTTSGAATPTVGVFPPPSGSVPAEWTRLIDDTQQITITVPGDWNQTSLAPFENDDGTPRPAIAATTDASLFFPTEGTADTFSVPGVIFQAAPFTADTAAELVASVYHDQCSAEPVQSYDDGAFIGHIQMFNTCGGTATRIVQLVANPANGSFTARVLIQLTGQPDDSSTLDGLLSSFNAVTGANTPTSTAAAATTTSAAAAATRRPTHSSPSCANSCRTSWA